MGGVVRCVKILVLVSLIPLALRAGSLLGHIAPLPSPHAGRPVSSSNSAASGGSSGSVRGRTALGATTTASFRHGRGGGGGGGSGDGFGDEKRMAPSGSNPLHNLR